MKYTVLKNTKTNEELIIINDDSICSISDWNTSDTEHHHYESGEYIPNWDDEELSLYGKHGNLISKYKILNRIDGKNVYKRIV
jgi:hypothetical protein